MKVEDLVVGKTYRCTCFDAEGELYSYEGTSKDGDASLFNNGHRTFTIPNKNLEWFVTELSEPIIVKQPEPCVDDKALIADPPMYQTPNDVAEHVVEEHKKEMINHPSHYQGLGIETIVMMERIWGKDAVIQWCQMTSFKYRMRAGYKDDTNQDIDKALWYEEYVKKLQKASEL